LSRQALEASPKQRSGRLAQAPEVVDEGRADQLKRQDEQDWKGRPHHVDEKSDSTSSTCSVLFVSE
jgi:hypothetical protein